jgi:hypothetical protein
MFHLYDHLQGETNWKMNKKKTQHTTNNFYKRIENLTNITFKHQKTQLLSKPLKYNLHHKHSKSMYIFPPEDGHTTETCSGYWIKYSNQCCVRRKPWTCHSTHNRMQTTNFKQVGSFAVSVKLAGSLSVASTAISWTAYSIASLNYAAILGSVLTTKSR